MRRRSLPRLPVRTSTFDGLNMGSSEDRSGFFPAGPLCVYVLTRKVHCHGESLPRCSRPRAHPDARARATIVARVGEVCV